MHTGMVLFGAVCQLVGAFIVKNQLRYAGSLWFGILFAVAGSLHMARTLDRALAEGAEGFIQVLMEKDTRTTVGIQIVGEGAPELLSFAALAVKNRMTFDEWRQFIVAHPSLAEMIKEAALDCFGMSVHGAVR